ncbi:hypothetical protein P692DRAFT_20512898 [Suillus brevipes Sb2]|nr:hypothetical protein P692DRAFT_20512898 [Suillus brevipes Sb2]
MTSDIRCCDVLALLVTSTSPLIRLYLTISNSRPMYKMILLTLTSSSITKWSQAFSSNMMSLISSTQYDCHVCVARHRSVARLARNSAYFALEIETIYRSRKLVVVPFRNVRDCLVAGKTLTISLGLKSMIAYGSRL